MYAIAALAVVAALFRAGARHNDTKRDNEATTAEAETKERIDESISNGVGVPWRDRLRDKR
jgi:hypothetical protein